MSWQPGSELLEPIGLTQPTVSHPLRMLMVGGFVTRSTRGTWAYHTLVPGALDGLSHLLQATSAR